MFQAKGFPYRIADLFGDTERVGAVRRRPLRHAAADVEHVPPLPRPARRDASSTSRYISGDTWNVNPIALERVERLFCRNERAVIRMRLPAARRARRWRWCRWPRSWSPASGCTSSTCCCTCATRGPNEIACDAPVRKGEETGLVRARLDDHRLRAAGVRARRRNRHRPANPHGTGLVAAAFARLTPALHASLTVRPRHARHEQGRSGLVQRRRRGPPRHRPDAAVSHRRRAGSRR